MVPIYNILYRLLNYYLYNFNLGIEHKGYIYSGDVSCYKKHTNKEMHLKWAIYLVGMYDSGKVRHFYAINCF